MLDLAIIGAGPYGLSLAAHLQSTDVNFRQFGKTMESWKHRMPPGMLLKSHPWSSCLYHPDGKMSFEEFCHQRKVPYHDSTMEAPLELYCDYGEAFQKVLGLDVADKKAVNITAVPDGFRIVFDDGEVVTARRVVVAVGVHPFDHVPDVLAELPEGLVSHSGDYGPLERLDGREVVVVGSGASAIDLATLLHERGVSTTMLARATKLHFMGAAPRNKRPLLRRLARPGSGIGAGWLLWIYANAPWLVHALPGPMRRHIVRTTLGPLGGPSMKGRVVGKLPVMLGWEVLNADLVDGRVQLAVRNRAGEERMVAADHVVAATGYRPDVARLSFLDPALRRRIRTADGAPVLSTNYETSVRGLHFIGPAAAPSFGPVCRFVFGAKYPARRLARRFAADAVRRPEPLRGERELAAAEGV